MATFRLAIKGIVHYWKLSVCLCVGVALATSILTGSLLVGDSVRKTLETSAFERIGTTKAALVGGDRFFTSALSLRINESLIEAKIAPILFVPATLSTPDKKKRANSIWVYGVDENFWNLSGADAPGGDFFAIGEALAEQKSLNPGDRITVRAELPGRLSRDAPLSGETEKLATLSARITHIINTDQNGNFSLLAEQASALNVFVPLHRLQEELEKPQRANLLLSDVLKGFDSALQNSWELADAELKLRKPNDEIAEIVSERVFISETAEKKILEVDPSAEPVLSYLINDIRLKENSVPYSVGTGIGPKSAKRLGVQMPSDDEIIINEWLSRDKEKGGLSAGKGDALRISFYSVRDSRDFITVGDELDVSGKPDPNDVVEFTVSSVVPSEKDSLRYGWVPEFPGLDSAKTLSSWESGMPLDMQRIRPSDERYWELYKATPKTFLSLETARLHWGNRFGQTTSILLGDSNVEEPDFLEKLRSNLTLYDLGVSLRSTREEAQQSVSNALDFGALFGSLSGFLIIASLLLVLILCVFGIESRFTQLGALGAIGFTRSRIRNLLILESFFVVLAGTILGSLGAVIYTKAALWSLGGVWNDAAAGVKFIFASEPKSIFIGASVICFTSIITICFIVRRATSQTPRELLAGCVPPISKTIHKKGNYKRLATIVLGLIGGIVCVFLGNDLQGEQLAGSFFGAGFCFLLSFICGFSHFLNRINRRTGNSPIRFSEIGHRNASRRPGRSLAVVAAVSSGVFLVVAVNAFRLKSNIAPEKNDSGTGGFEFFAKSTLPIYKNLNDPKIRDQFGFEEYSEDDISFLPFRVLKGGEEASCQNLNHAVNPRLIGVNPDSLIEGKSFRFAGLLNQFNGKDVFIPKNTSGWEILRKEFGQNVVPVIGDKASVMWAMKKKIGSLIEYPDGNGGSIKLLVAGLLENSILQGNLVMSDHLFKKHFPRSGGYQMFLINTKNANDAKTTELIQSITKALDRRGIEFISSSKRLADYSKVQNTYISIFSVLGGLGVLLGTVGVGILIARNVLERRSEMAIMIALGFQRKNLTRLLLSEHLLLVCFGILAGLISALIAVSPNIIGKAAQFPFSYLFIIVLMILVGSIIFCVLSARLALKGGLLNAIRTE